MRIITILGTIACGSLALGQQTDPQTDVHEKRDEAYLQRVLEHRPDPATIRGRVLAGDNFRELTEEMMRSGARRSRSSEHYTIRSDDPRIDLDATIELLESLYAHLDRSPPGGIELRDVAEPCAVFLFHSAFHLRQLPRISATIRGDGPIRVYHRPSNTIAVHSDGGDGSVLAEAIVDLASHELVERRVIGTERRASPWIAQGLSHYLAFTFRNRHGEFQTGRVGGKSTRLFRDTPDQGRAAAGRLRRVQRKLRRIATGDGTMLEDFLTAANSRGSGSSDSESNYGIGWSLVHYLLHGADNRFRGTFSLYLGQDLAGQTGTRTLFEALGSTPAELESGMRAHVLSQKALPRFRWGTSRRSRVVHSGSAPTVP